MLEEVDPSEARAKHGPAFRRFRAYRGTVTELGWIAVNVAVLPLALIDEAVRGSARRVRVKPEPQRRAKRPPKDAAEIPIVLIHGYFHNRSGLIYMQRSLRRQGFKHVHTFSYNPVRKTIPEMAASLASRVEHIRDTTGSKRVHLIGHSLGGLLARYYVEQLEGAPCVHTLVSIGTPHHGSLIAFMGRSAAAQQMRPGSEFIRMMGRARKPRNVRYLSYYSNLDLVASGGSAALENGNGSRVQNILVHDLGHLSLLISPELTASIGAQLSDV